MTHQTTDTTLPDPERTRAAFARDVAAGLRSTPRRLPCCYFYDALGSALFEAICELPEYYLTRAETEILRAHSAEIAGLFRGALDLIELGSGSSVKSRLLIDALLAMGEPLRYVPIDISASMLASTAERLRRDYPSLAVTAIAAEYREGIERLRTPAAAPRLVLWLGSNIGNFERGQAAALLADIASVLAAGDRLLVGIDLRKDRAILEAAYDDPTGVTAAFNLNILGRINRELGGQFDLRAFVHRATYDEAQGCVEMYLVSNCGQRVPIAELGVEAVFADGEAILTEQCYKYSPAEIDMLAEAAGLRRGPTWLDAAGGFSLNVLEK